LNRYPLYILDLDGTLFRGNETTPGAVETVAALRRQGAQVKFLTNNSGGTRAHYLEKLARLGFDPEPHEIYSSAIGAARYCREQGIEKVFAVGEPGLEETLQEAGIVLVDERAEAVVAGICRSFTYRWMNDAMQNILAGAQFIATNADATYPVEGGRLEPGAGSIVAAIATCSGQSPTVVGKPNPYLIHLILKEAGVQPGDALVVGDRLDTDIACGAAAGCPTHLVLCGVTQEAPAAQRWSADLRGLL
jgi:4-nitrophenyl phosphatase